MHNEVRKMFGERLKWALDANNIKQTNLAKELGISQQGVNRWCQNLTQPDNDTIVKIAQYLNVSTDYLLGNDRKKDNKLENEIKEKEILKQVLVKNGYMKENEDLTNEELKKLMEFVKTNKKYIKEVK